MTVAETITRLRAIDAHARALEANARIADHWPDGGMTATTLRIAAAWWRAFADRLSR